MSIQRIEQRYCLYCREPLKSDNIEDYHSTCKQELDDYHYKLTAPSLEKCNREFKMYLQLAGKDFDEFTEEEKELFRFPFVGRCDVLYYLMHRSEWSFGKCAVKKCQRIGPEKRCEKHTIVHRLERLIKMMQCQKCGQLITKYNSRTKRNEFTRQILCTTCHQRKEDLFLIGRALEIFDTIKPNLQKNKIYFIVEFVNSNYQWTPENYWWDQVYHFNPYQKKTKKKREYAND